MGPCAVAAGRPARGAHPLGTLACRRVHCMLEIALHRVHAQRTRGKAHRLAEEPVATPVAALAGDRCSSTSASRADWELRT